ncbi:MAG: ribonuclease H-like domain-containing protein [Bacteroidota bacterium]
MNRVVFDIETMAVPPESLQEEQREYLFRFADTEQKRTEALQQMNLSPFTARIIAIAMLNPDTGGGKVFYEDPVAEPSASEDGRVEFVPGSERETLQGFWGAIERYTQFITFNGRGFDCPFLMLRSAMLKVKPTRNLVPYRYSTAESIDLLEQLGFYGGFRRFSLDFYCRAFGIQSPKAGGITGLDLPALHAAGRFREIAEYCLGDVVATAELFRIWETHLRFERPAPPKHESRT